MRVPSLGPAPCESAITHSHVRELWTVNMPDSCIHDMDPAWCAYCGGEPDSQRTSSPSVRRSSSGRTKQDELDLLCDQLGIPRRSVGVGSSLPSDVFDVLRRRFGVAAGSMPEVAEQVAKRAGLTWLPEYDSRATLSGGGSTVTRTGLAQLNRAVASLVAAGL